MNKKRLLKLADFLETVPRRAFNMDYWVAREATKPEGKAPGSCGFAGCAMGWAQHAKLFRGLELGESWVGEQTPTFNGATGFEAAAQLFSIDHGNSRFLFGSDSYGAIVNPTPKQVAKRIRKFVETGVVT